MGPEGVGVIPGRDPGRFYGLLGPHSENGDIEESLDHALGLGVAAGAAERHEEFAVLEGYGGIGGEAGTLPGPEARRVVGFQPALITPT